MLPRRNQPGQPAPTMKIIAFTQAEQGVVIGTGRAGGFKVKLYIPSVVAPGIKYRIQRREDQGDGRWMNTPVAAHYQIALIAGPILIPRRNKPRGVI